MLIKKTALYSLYQPHLLVDIAQVGDDLGTYPRKFRNNYIIAHVNIASVLLASVGVITGGATLNPIVLGKLTAAGILLKSYHEFKNIKSKTDLLKFSVTSYEKS